MPTDITCVLLSARITYLTAVKLAMLHKWSSVEAMFSSLWRSTPSHPTPPFTNHTTIVFHFVLFYHFSLMRSFLFCSWCLVVSRKPLWSQTPSTFFLLAVLLTGAQIFCLGLTFPSSAGSAPYLFPSPNTERTRKKPGVGEPKNDNDHFWRLKTKGKLWTGRRRGRLWRERDQAAAESRGEEILYKNNLERN